MPPAPGHQIRGSASLGPRPWWDCVCGHFVASAGASPHVAEDRSALGTRHDVR